MRLVRRIAIGAAALLAVLLGAAWVLPPFWDWGRQRGAMEALATAALGRAVHIDGAISLTLLPEPMLVASGVRVQGRAESEGMAASGEWRIRSLRLGVALGPLLRGHVVARELVLQGPEIRLPWPPPAGAAGRLALPDWYGGFAGRIEDGHIHIGTISLRDIRATITSAEDGMLHATARLRLGGETWQLTARIGPADRDGLTGVELTLTGQDRAAGSRLTFASRPGAINGFDGRLSLSTADASLWASVPALALRAEGDLHASPEGWAWRNITLDLAEAPARAEVVLGLHPAPSLRANMQATRLSLDPWRPILAGGRDLHWPLSFVLDAGSAALGEGNLRQLQLRLSSMDGALLVDAASAILPGEAPLHLSGQLRQTADGPVFAGRGTLEAADPRTTLRWLAGLHGGTFPALPVDMVRRLSLAADFSVGGGQWVLHGLTGQIDQSRVQGQLTFRPGHMPALRAAMTLDQLTLDPALGDISARWPDLFGGTTMDMQLRVGTANLGGRVLSELTLDTLLEPERLHLRRGEAMLDGARITASGQFGAGGRLADGKLEISADDAAPAALWLPASWRGHPALWDGRLALRAEAAGPMDALAMQLAIDLGDARLEAQPVMDLANRRLVGRMSLRHPSAVRLLAGLGWLAGTAERGAPVWPGQGSLGLQAQFNLHEDQLSVDGFDLTAGGLRASGRLGILWQGGLLQGGPLQGGPARLGGRIAAKTLPLPWFDPGSSEPLANMWLRGWAGTLLVAAESVTLDDRAVLEGLQCALAQDAGVIQLSACNARLADGVARIDARLDTSASPSRLAVEMEVKDGRIENLMPPGLDLRADRADMLFSAQGVGNSPAALLASLAGRLRLTARDGAWRGFDLAAAQTALTQTALAQTALAQTALASGGTASLLDAALQAALTQGQTPFQQLDLAAELREGGLAIHAAQSTGPHGKVRLAGRVGLDGGGLDLHAALRPARTEAGATELPELTLRLSGRADAPRRAIDIAAALRWLATQPP